MISNFECLVVRFSWFYQNSSGRFITLLVAMFTELEDGRQDARRDLSADFIMETSSDQNVKGELCLAVLAIFSLSSH